jgi:hypothetical protein
VELTGGSSFLSIWRFQDEWLTVGRCAYLTALKPGVAARALDAQPFLEGTKADEAGEEDVAVSRRTLAYIVDVVACTCSGRAQKKESSTQ